MKPNYGYSNLRNLVGVQLQTSGLPENMRVDEAINFFSAYHNVIPRYDLLARLNLKDKAKVQYQSLSTGLKTSCSCNRHGTQSTNFIFR